MKEGGVGGKSYNHHTDGGEKTILTLYGLMRAIQGVFFLHDRFRCFGRLLLLIVPHRQCGGCKIFLCHPPSFLPSSSASPSATFFARTLHPIGDQYSQQLL